MTPSSQPKQITAQQAFALAMTAEANGRSAEAEAYFSALASRGHIAIAAGILTNELEAAGRFKDAEAVLRAGLKREPGHLALKGALGRLLLREGDYPEGWALLEDRDIEISRTIRGRPRLSFPEWRGEPVGSLLVFGEQGLGDQIQFARFVAVLRDRGIDVILACGPPLIPLFEPLGVKMIPTVMGMALPRCDAWVMLLSLPFVLGTTLDTIPPQLNLAQGPGGGGVGLALAGNPEHTNDKNRSLPGDLAEALRALPGMVSLDPRDTGAADFRDTAKIIEGLSQVVTVDTAVAHLAGSMGKPTRVLLPALADWRWLRDRTDSPWYPSVTLYRQQRAGDWGSVLDAVRQDLAQAA